MSRALAGRWPAAPLLVLAVVLAVALAACDAAPAPTAEPGAEGALVVTSPAFDDGGTIPVRHTCDGQDAPLPLQWTGVPADAAEVAVLVEDPDAENGGGSFVHWVAAGIDPGASGISDDEEPPVQGVNDFGSTGYRGPCPPAGDDPHRYVVTVVAAGRRLDLPPQPSAADLREALADRAVARGELVGRYGR